MDPSADVKSLVRGWLQTSPNVGRVKLTPPSLVPTFSPRPERLGLGAVPPRDLEIRAYHSRLEKRIKRKLLGKRKPDNTPIVCDSGGKNLDYDSSDEMCSRSTSIHSKHHFPSPVKPLKKTRKRKKKIKTLSEETPTSYDSSYTAGLTEEPLPQRRRDILCGGAQQDVATQSLPLISAEPLLAVTKSKESANEESDSKCSYKQRESVAFAKNEVDRTKKRRKYFRCVRYRSSLPWSAPPLRFRLRRNGRRCTSWPKGF